jgi:hypothetical protein
VVPFIYTILVPPIERPAAEVVGIAFCRIMIVEFEFLTA